MIVCVSADVRARYMRSFTLNFNEMLDAYVMTTTQWRW